VSNTNANYQAAGTAATAARATVKESWHKNPTILNIIIGIVVILVALVINATFPFNLFWKLLLGGALVWGGGKLAKVTAKGVISLWGNIFKGLGWTMIVIALLNSGLRHAGEKSVIWVDETLTELSGQAAGPNNHKKNVPAVDDKPVMVPLIRQPGQTESIWVPVGSVMDHSTMRHPVADGKSIYLSCGKITAPEVVATSSDPAITGHQIENTTGPGKYRNELRFTEATRIFLAKNGISRVLVTFDLQATSYDKALSTCAHTKW
jgi:hypothetical protein